MLKNPIRPATPEDVSRLAEIEIFDYRLFYPIFQNVRYYFDELTVLDAVEAYRRNAAVLQNTYVYADSAVKGFIRIDGKEVKKLFVEPVLHGQSIGTRAFCEKR